MEKVKIYSTSSCPWCHKTKEFFQENSIKFQDIDVAADPKAAQHMFQISGQMGVPVTEIGKEVIVGFDKPRLKKALNLA